jgi:hypothetical protein
MVFDFVVVVVAAVVVVEDVARFLPNKIRRASLRCGTPALRRALGLGDGHRVLGGHRGVQHGERRILLARNAWKKGGGLH